MIHVHGYIGVGVRRQTFGVAETASVGDASRALVHRTQRTSPAPAGVMAIHTFSGIEGCSECTGTLALPIRSCMCSRVD